MANENSLRSYRDFDAYDRDAREREREPAVSGVSGGDPLADLARIMGQDDGYAELLKAVARTRGEHAGLVGGAASENGAGTADDPAIDWEDLEAELAKHREAAGDLGADGTLQVVDLRGSHEAWPGEAAAADDIERRLAAEFERSFVDERRLEGLAAPHVAAGAAGLAGVAGAAYALRSEPGRVQPVAAADSEPADHQFPAYSDEEPPRRRHAGVTAVAAVLALALAGGGGVYAYRAMTGPSGGGEPRIVRADTSPVRVAVQPAGGARPAADRSSGAERVVPREERPVSLREQAAQVQEPPTPARVIPLYPAPATSGVVTDPGQPTIRTVAAVPVTAPAAASPPAAPIQARVPEEPRRVRTVQVGPDGSILTPSPPAVPVQAAATTPVSAQALSVVPVAAPALAAAEARPAPVPAPRPVQTIRVARSEPAAAPSVEPARPVQARPEARAQPLDLGPQRTASVRTAATAGGSTFVQISSHQSEAEARSAFSTASRRFPLLQGQTPNIRTAEIPGRGTWHRLRVGPFSREEAQGFCQRLKAAGGSCVLN